MVVVPKLCGRLANWKCAYRASQGLGARRTIATKTSRRPLALAGRLRALVVPIVVIDTAAP